MKLAFENKLIAVINKEVEIGTALNSIAHASIVLGAQIGTHDLKVEEYKDGSGIKYPISSMPFIILRGKSSEIRKLVTLAKEDDMKHIAFLESMTGGTYQEQIIRTAATSPEDLKYYCAVLFGPWDKVSEMTKKFSLYK